MIRLLGSGTSTDMTSSNSSSGSMPSSLKINMKIINTFNGIKCNLDGHGQSWIYSVLYSCTVRSLEGFASVVCIVSQVCQDIPLL